MRQPSRWAGLQPEVQAQNHTSATEETDLRYSAAALAAKRTVNHLQRSKHTGKLENTELSQAGSENKVRVNTQYYRSTVRRVTLGPRPTSVTVTSQYLGSDWQLPKLTGRKELVT